MNRRASTVGQVARRSSAGGFSLIELMTIVAVIAVLSVVALTSYREYVLRAKVEEAAANLSDWRFKLQAYYANHGGYGAGSVCGVPAPVFPVAKYFTYRCSSGGLDPVGGDQT